jgi:calcineurin-like phosphoesterase family protein
VVITHHAPHPGSIAPKFATHPLNPAFVSNLEHLMGRAQLWIHGHTHRAFDYTVRGTRVVCNPRGNADEVTGFLGDLVVEV